MLTRSPVAPRSTNSSPAFHGYGPSHSHSHGNGHGRGHYAPALSPRQSPSLIAAAAAASGSRRQSASSSTTGTLAEQQTTRPKRYVSVDAATQYSPTTMVRDLAASPVPSARASTSSNQAPSHTRSETMGGVDQQGSGSPAQQAAATTGAQSKAQYHTNQGSHLSPAAVPGSLTSSPNKRRSSEGPAGSTADPSVINSPGTFAKRSKIAAGAPKVLPRRFELCPIDDMVVLIANMLGELIETNDALALSSGHLTRFHSRTAPGISVLDYLHRLAKHATLPTSLLLVMVYYIDRLCALYPDFTINTLTVHRFLITAATVAAKGLSDQFWNNSTYARVGGVRVAELKLLELEFLYRVDWKIVPSPDVLVAYYRGLIERNGAYVMQGEEGDSGGGELRIAGSGEGEAADEGGGPTGAQTVAAPPPVQS